MLGTGIWVMPGHGLSTALSLQGTTDLLAVQTVKLTSPGGPGATESDSTNCSTNCGASFTVHGVTSQGAHDDTDDSSTGCSLLFPGHARTPGQGQGQKQYHQSLHVHLPFRFKVLIRRRRPFQAPSKLSVGRAGGLPGVVRLFRPPWREERSPLRHPRNCCHWQLLVLVLYEVPVGHLLPSSLATSNPGHPHQKCTVQADQACRLLIANDLADVGYMPVLLLPWPQLGHPIHLWWRWGELNPRPQRFQFQYKR